MTLVTQQKPIERLSDMVLMTKKSQIEAWLNGLYTENRYGQRITSKHVRAGRPGVPAPVMTVKIRLSLPAHNSGSCRFVCIDIMFVLLLSPCHSNCGYFLSRSANCFALKAVFFKRGVCISKYHFAKLRFCQKYYFARMSCCQNIVMPKNQN